MQPWSRIKGGYRGLEFSALSISPGRRHRQFFGFFALDPYESLQRIRPVNIDPMLGLAGATVFTRSGLLHLIWKHVKAISSNSSQFLGFGSSIEERVGISKKRKREVRRNGKRYRLEKGVIDASSEHRAFHSDVPRRRVRAPATIRGKGGSHLRPFPSMIAVWASLRPPKELGSRREICRQVTILHPQSVKNF